MNALTSDDGNVMGEELTDSLAMHDVSLILNGMARSRRSCNSLHG